MVKYTSESPLLNATKFKVLYELSSTTIKIVSSVAFWCANIYFKTPIFKKKNKNKYNLKKNLNK